MIFKQVFVCILCFSFFTLSGQVVKKNKDGLKIVEYEDGTWRFYENGDSNLVSMNQNIIDDQLAIGEDSIRNVPLKIQIYYRTKLSEFQDAISREKEMQGLVNILQLQIKEAQSLKDNDYLEGLFNQLEQVLKQQKNIKKEIKKAEKAFTHAKQLRRAKTAYQVKWLVKYEKQNGIMPIPYAVSQPLPVIDSEDLQKPVNKNKNSEQSASGHQIFVKNEFVQFMAEPVPCEFQFNGVDPFTKKRKIEVKPQVLFKHTPDELLPYLKDKPYLICYAHVSSTPGFKFLTLSFIIHSDRAKQSFGRLSQGSSLSIRLIDGTIINMFNNSADEGMIDFNSKTTKYTGSYIISRKDEKELRNKEIDRVRVVWTSGFEEYEIFELDFLMDQLNCLNN